MEVEIFGWTLLDYFQTIVDGVLYGATYAIIGIGFTLIFGVMDKLNLAYAATALAGAYFSWGVGTQIPLPAPVAYVISSIAAGGFGYLVYLCNFRYIPSGAPLASLLATVGMLLFLEELIVHSTQGMPQPYPALFDDVMLEWGDFGMRGDLLFVFCLCVLATVFLLYVLYRTKLGMATRAVAQQPVAAQLCGMSVQGTNSTTFVIAGAIGGIAGAMIGASVGILSPLLTVPITVKGLIAAVIGGLGSIPGAIVGGLLIGAFENTFQLLRSVTERDMYVMLLLFAFLAFRPGGIFGTASRHE